MKQRLVDLSEALRSSAVGVCLSREMPPEKWLRRVISSVVIFLAALAVLMALFDPCFQYHDWKFIPRIYTQAYWQIPGILKTFDYDTVFIGSSTSRSFDLAVVRRELGIKPVKATANSCTPHSGRVFAETAIRFNPKLERIYYGLDLFAFFYPPDLDKSAMPDFLYSGTHRKDYCYWWNYDIIFTFLQDVQWKFGSLIRRDGQFTDPDLMFAGNYLSNLKKHGRKPIVKAIRDDTFRQSKLATEGEAAALRRFAENLDRNFVPLVKNHPSIEFIFFLPPSPAINYSDAKSCGTLELFLQLRCMIAEKLLAFPNVRLYDFQTVPETLDIENYKDLVHYVPTVNDTMVTWLRQDKYRVRTPAEVAENNLVLKEYADRLMPLWKDILAEAGKN